MSDELDKLESLRQQGILSQEAYWDARSRLLSPPTTPPTTLPTAQPTTLPATPPNTPPAGPFTAPFAAAPSTGFAVQGWVADDVSLGGYPAGFVPRSARHQGGRRRGRAGLIAAFAVIAVAAAGVGAYFAWWRDTSVVVSATYVLKDKATAEAGCIGQGDNSAIVAGEKTELYDQRGHVIGRGTLSEGTSDDDTCTFHVRMTSVSQDAVSYSLEVPGFARHTMTRDELTAAGWQFAVRQDPPTGDVTGTLELSDVDTVLNDCVGAYGYDDIGEGSPVVIRDQDGRILGSSSLDAGTPAGYGTCSYTFTVSDVVRDQDQYTVEVSHRGGITDSRAELEDSDWAFSLTLGS